MKRRGARAPAEPPLVDLIRQLGGLLNELGLGELEVTSGDTHVRLTRPLVGAAAPPPAVQSAPAVTVEALAMAAPGTVTVEAPMVGTFYRASSPTAEPYVREGDVVKEGQILCIIEAMKLMNEIEAKTAGRIAKILAENGQGVEFGQPLFLIEPTR
jgi:acetyl-CoA carboxylase biotin carboxyl carrier protein